jgi:hypothetical protein
MLFLCPEKTLLPKLLCVRSLKNMKPYDLKHKVIWEAKFFLDTKTAYLKALLYYYGDIHTSEKFIFERKWTYHLQYDTIPRYKGYQVIFFCLYALIF